MVIEFLSYEGIFIVVGGFVDGMMSIDVGVSELGSVVVGFLIQLIDGVWVFIEGFNI